MVTSQLLFSAKLTRSTPPPKQASERDREYLRPHEVEAMINASRKVGIHGVRDSVIILGV